jgi:hypothetical protein
LKKEKTLTVWTPYGDYYKVNEKGEIKSNNLDDFSPDWKLLGIQHVKRNDFISLEFLFRGDIPPALTYKNGNPQWTIRDLDHGTVRVWGNTTVHGIRGITLTDAGK